MPKCEDPIIFSCLAGVRAAKVLFKIIILLFCVLIKSFLKISNNRKFYNDSNAVL